MQNKIANSAANIAGKYVDQHNLADVTNAGNSSGASITPASYGNRSSSKRSQPKISVNTDVELSSTARPVNTSTKQSGSPYGRTISPANNELSSAHGFTYGSANPESTSRRPVNPTGAAPLGKYGRAVNSNTNSPISSRGREFVASSEALRNPTVRKGNPGHENIPGKSPAGSGGVSESLERLNLRDDARGAQRSNVTQ